MKRYHDLADFSGSAEVYGPFTNEELVAESLAPFSGQVVIATKFGFKLKPNLEPGFVVLDSRPSAASTWGIRNRLRSL